MRELNNRRPESPAAGVFMYPRQDVRKGVLKSMRRSLPLTRRDAAQPIPHKIKPAPAMGSRNGLGLGLEPV